MHQPGWVGQTLGGRYQVEELLGQGGMSAVYKATDPNLKRVVAVKTIHPHLSGDAGFVSRFEEEATSVASLRHPNIVQVYDFNHDQGTYYMVLEFIPGESLYDRLKRLNQAGRSLSLAEIIDYTTGICEAVDYAHQRGLIHRDIKPANVMLSVQGQAILMDFGIVKILGATQHTATGAVVGTAMYMSPEQIKGERVDHRTDIYSLGIMLYEMVSGKPPFQAESAMTLMMMHINDPVPDLRATRPNVPPAMVGIINKALEKNPNQRYQRASELAADLRRLAAQLRTQPHEGFTVQQTSVPNQGRTSVQAISTSGSQPVPVTGAASRVYPASTGLVVENPGRTGSYDQPAKPAGNKRLLLLIAGFLALFLVICLVAGGIYLGSQFLNGQGGLAAEPPTQTSAIQQAVVTPLEAAAILPSATPTPEPATPTNEPTQTPTITPTPSPEYTATPTVPAGIPYVRINNITIDGDHYVVEYETFEYTESLPGAPHVHFFFDTVPPEQAGSPGSGPWILYGGPRPFTEYKLSARPSGATMMCALVANANHTVQANSGNCFPLP